MLNFNNLNELKTINIQKNRFINYVFSYKNKFIRNFIFFYSFFLINNQFCFFIQKNNPSFNTNIKLINLLMLNEDYNLFFSFFF